MSTTFYNPCLLIFAKNLKVGNAKTRIAQTLGEEASLQIYKVLLEYTMKITEKLEYPVYVYWDESVPESTYPFTDKYHFRKQEGKNLGEKIQNAFQDLLPNHSPICIIGSDTPYLTESILNSAFKSLTSNAKCCIGPATDGGYYLLGIHSEPEIWFKDIQWSTSSVYNDTLSIAFKNHIPPYILPMLSDIDTEEDVRQWIKNDPSVEILFDLKANNY
jgi:uncharacterized protein